MGKIAIFDCFGSFFGHFSSGDVEKTSRTHAQFFIVLGFPKTYNLSARK
jgi:hypothetical protein